MRTAALLLALLCVSCTAHFGPDPGWGIGWSFWNQANLEFKGMGIEVCIGCLEVELDPNSAEADSAKVP